ncbi:hypothetical protein D3C81_794340 [compost metagenome]
MNEQQRQFGRHVGVHAQGGEYHPQAVERAADNVRRGYPVTGQFEPAVAQAGHVEQVLDVAVQALGLVARTFEQFAPVFFGYCLAQRQQAVDTAAHGSQGRAQVVGH